MAAKITRLNDPANPYNVKRTPTSAPSEEQKARNKAASDALRAMETPSAPPPPPRGNVDPAMRRANRQFNDARDAKIERTIMAKTLRRGK